ncbi:hypothetical protein CR513_00963, partial [Mucuna pruriens]
MYQRLVGKLIYLAHIRPNIAYPMSVISQFIHNPGESHLQAIYKVLHYLKGNLGKGILFKRNNILAIEKINLWILYLPRGGLVTWRNKKQDVVVRSQVESELKAITQGLCKLLWLKIILDDLKIELKNLMKLYCDYKSAINNTYNPVQHNMTKYIEIDRHFIK